ncbi:MAG: nucleotidyltransferase domain-containing protein [Crenarchaeota archaeon]|nr:nucleotidyltransferase domain-containing protein [Thermoproteota archaeon]
MEMFFPREKGRIIEYVLDNPSKTIRVRELAKNLKVSPAYASRSLKLLRKLKIIRNGKADLSNPLTRALKTLLNVKRLIDKRIVKTLQTLEIVGAGVYGSWASGTNTEDSDVDIWIRVDKHPGELKVAIASAEIRGLLNKNVQLLVLTPERLERLRVSDPSFYYSLVFGSIVLYGENVG